MYYYYSITFLLLNNIKKHKLLNNIKLLTTALQSDT